MRIRELAKELGIDGKVIISYLQDKGNDVKSTLNSVPDDLANELRSKYAGASTQKAASGAGGIKAAPLPEHLLKKLDEGSRAKQAAPSENEENKKTADEPGPGETAEDKKTKISGVYNPQYSQNKADTSSADKKADAGSKKADKPLPSQVHPAKDRKPDDFVPAAKNTAAEPEKDADIQEQSSVTAGKNAVTDAGITGTASDAGAKVSTPPAAETTTAGEEKHKVTSEQEADKKAGKNAAEAKPDAGAKKAAEKSPAGTAASKDKTSGRNSSDGNKKNAKDQGSDPAKVNPQNKNEGEKSSKSNTSGSVNAAAAKTSDTRTGKESEAVQSLRAKLVKGTINPEDFLIPSPKSVNKQNNKNNGQKQNGQRNNNTSRAGRNGSDSGSRGGNQRSQAGSRFSTAGQAVRDNGSRSGSAGDRQNARGGRDVNKSSENHAGAAAPAQGAGRTKKQAAKPVRGKYDKNRGDKFDRLENEKAAQRSVKAAAAAEPEEEIKVITLPDTISVKDFAAKLKMQPAALIKKLFLQGKVFTLNDVLDFDTAEELALDMDIICEHEVQVDYIQELLKEDEDPEETLVKRPPVVCIMGHVDHGKTSLLDAIRKTNVTAGEAGGITQRIGAYTVDVNGRSITFLDTPGHEAFTSMRLRGAQATDVAILVVAADDGVMPQTIEAINHAKAANIHVIVAVNKIDKPGANIDKVKQELSDQGLVPEDWGGSTIFVPVSAKTREGIDNLLEMVLLDTEILDLKANPDRMARGVVIEAKLDKGRGSVATLLVQKGTLKCGDYVAMGESHGKVRVMTDDKGKSIKTAPPSTPVEITGLNGVPVAGEVFVAFDNDKAAKNFAQVYVEENKKKLLAGSRTKMSLDDVFSQIKAGELKELNIIIKADLQGSVEALKESLEKLSNDEVVVKVIHSGAGSVTESDAILASASNAIIIAFNVDTNPAAKSTIEQEHVDLRKYSVIYNAIDDVEAAMKGMLEPLKEEVIIGQAEIRQVFKSSGVGLIAGTYVTDGVIKNTASVRLSRDGEQIYDGPVASLKRFSDDAKEVRAGFECGVVLKDHQDIKEGDTMEIYEMRVVPRT